MTQEKGLPHCRHREVLQGFFGFKIPDGLSAFPNEREAPRLLAAVFACGSLYLMDFQYFELCSERLGGAGWMGGPGATAGVARLCYRRAPAGQSSTATAAHWGALSTFGVSFTTS